MVAGFMAGYMEKEDYLQAFRMGIAAGSASAFSENLCNPGGNCRSVYEQITNKKKGCDAVKKPGTGSHGDPEKRCGV